MDQTENHGAWFNRGLEIEIPEPPLDLIHTTNQHKCITHFTHIYMYAMCVV